MAKQRRSAEPVAMRMDVRITDALAPGESVTVNGVSFGMEKGPEGHLVFRLDAGVARYITPQRKGQDLGESKLRALARLRDAIVAEYAGPTPRRMA